MSWANANYLLGHLEDVEDKLLHLDSIGLLGFPGDTIVIHIRDLLLGDVVQESSLALADHQIQELDREEVVGDVTGGRT